MPQQLDCGPQLPVVAFSLEVHYVVMILMGVTGCLLVLGTTVTLWWARTDYEAWEPGYADGAASGTDLTPAHRVPLRVAALRYLRGVAIALVGGFWAGLLVTGPAIRLIMRLLAVTAGDTTRAGSPRPTRWQQDQPRRHAWSLHVRRHPSGHVERRDLRPGSAVATERTLHGRDLRCAAPHA